MTREEFENECNDIINERAYEGPEPQHVTIQTDREWQLIETVYTYHPAIKNKKHMAVLYLDYGMSVITDMYLRAVKIQKYGK